MNFSSTLEKVLAEFEKGNYFFVIEYLDREKKWHAENLVINDHVSPEKAYEIAVQHAKEFGGRVSNFVENEAIKKFISQALTESIKEAFAEEDWKPIETAPKTGEHILVAQFDNSIGFGFCGGKNQAWYDVVHYWSNPGEEGFYPSNGPDEKYERLTHWKPLAALQAIEERKQKYLNE